MVQDKYFADSLHIDDITVLGILKCSDCGDLSIAFNHDINLILIIIRPSVVYKISYD